MNRIYDHIELNGNALASMFDLIVDLVFLMEVDGDSFRYRYVNLSAMNLLNLGENSSACV